MMTNTPPPLPRFPLSKKGTWVGIELEGATGKNDGSVQGIAYFACAPDHGIFARLDRVTVERTTAFLERRSERQRERRGRRGGRGRRARGGGSGSRPRPRRVAGGRAGGPKPATASTSAPPASTASAPAPRPLTVEDDPNVGEAIARAAIAAQTALEGLASPQAADPHGFGNAAAVDEAAYHALVDERVGSGGVFSDPDFVVDGGKRPHEIWGSGDEVSLFGAGGDPHPTDIVQVGGAWKKGQVFASGKMGVEFRSIVFLSLLIATDRGQGRVGDCFFMSALAVLAGSPADVRRLFLDDATSTVGLYACRFYHNGACVRVCECVCVCVSVCGTARG